MIGGIIAIILAALAGLAMRRASQRAKALPAQAPVPGTGQVIAIADEKLEAGQAVSVTIGPDGRAVATPAAEVSTMLPPGVHVIDRNLPDIDARTTLLVADVYPPDLDDPRTPQLDVPPFTALDGLTIRGKRVAGCYVKFSEGLAWGKKNETWAADSWRAMAELHGFKVGTFYRGAYHFLRFQQDGAKQADYFCDLVEKAGGWDGALIPMVDVEEGGQGGWAPGKLEKLDTATKARLARQVTACVTAFVQRFRERTGLRIAVYGRGVFRDLGMRQCMFTADAVVNPAYTAVMPKMDQYGVPLDRIAMWQCCGDGTVFLPGFPSKLPGWGATDYSVHINGSRPTTWRTFRAACLARQPG